MQQYKCTTALVIFLFTPTPHASTTPFQNLYLGGSLGYGQTALPRPASVTQFNRNGLAWSLLLGYQLYPWFSVEGGYSRMQNVKAAGVIQGVSISDTVEPNFAWLAMKGRYAFYQHLSLYGKLGAANVYGREKLRIANQETVNSQEKIRPYAALGIEMNIRPNLALDLGLYNTWKLGLIPRTTVFSASLLYWFN